jgi:multimeric flavodoxin WrbA
MVSGEYRKPLKWCQPGSIHALDSINHFFLIGQMIVPGSSYWNMGIGRNKGEVESDGEGLQTMNTLGQNMA